MSDACSRRGPLRRSGTTQVDRVLRELDPGHAPLDERSFGDLLVFAQRYARQLLYYRLDHQPTDADWRTLTFEPFFASDPAAVFAATERLPVATYRSFSRTLRRWLVADPAPSDDLLRRHAALLFRLPVLLLRRLGDHLERLPESDSLRSAASILAQREIGEPLRRLLRYEKGSRTGTDTAEKTYNDIDLLDPGSLNPAWFNLDGNSNGPRVPRAIADDLAGAPALADIEIAGGLLSRVVSDGFEKLYERDTHADDVPGTPPDASPFSAAGGVYADLRAALSYGGLTKALEQIPHAVEQIQLAASASLEHALTTDDHDAQYALWLTFCRLFATHQADLNGFTAKHREFYYERVLQLSPRDPTPDSAHLLIELKKSADKHEFEADTALNGGKDDGGAEVTYLADRDTVLNRGVVERLFAVYRPRAGAGAGEVLRAFASPVVNSADGAGEELPEDEPAWPPFGSESSPAARIGFALADRKLFLREGTRTITVTATLSAAPGSLSPGAFRARLTGEEEWIEAGVSDVTVSGSSLTLEVTLTPEQPAVVPHDPELHGAEFDTDLPMMIVELTLDADTDGSMPAASALTALDPLELTGIELQVTASGLRRFTAACDQGVLDTTKPFIPFTSQPHTGSAFVLGSAEVFSKPIDALKIRFEWQDELNRTDYYHQDKADEFTATAWRLAGGEWAEHQSDLTIFGVQTSLPAEIYEVQTLSAGLGSVSGFTVSTGFYEGHKVMLTAEKYPSIMKAMLLQQGLGTPDVLGQPAAKTMYLAPQMQTSEFELAPGVWEIEPNYPPAKQQTTTIDLSGVPDPGAEQTLKDPPYDASSVAGFLRLTLNKGFGHAEYTDKKTYALIQIAKYGGWEPADTDEVNYTAEVMPREPYTPTLTSLTLSYTSQTGAPAEFFHVHPFGYEALASPGRLLPELPNEGELYVGVSGLAPPSALTLLVRVAPGTANPLKSLEQASWGYLVGNEWKPVEAQHLDDGTSDLADTGIVTITVQGVCDTDHTVLPGGLHWFRLAVAEDSDAANDLLSVDAQAVRVTFSDDGNDPQFLAKPLPAGTISKLRRSDAAVKSITQPDESLGGAPAEDDDSFAVRVSGRLRHKDRASTLWDYERLVLDAFPGVYRVKCLPHTALCEGSDAASLADNELKPGGVVVVPVPYVTEGGPIDPLRPYADTATRSKIKTFLESRVSPFVRLEVQNPRFEQVRFSGRVAFTPEVTDTGFALAELIAALVDHLTPWSSRGDDITFGGVWHKASVIDFLEEREGVDYLTDVRMLHDPDLSGSYRDADLETVRATSARSILVSASEHDLKLVGAP